jgi:hypothetical protein
MDFIAELPDWLLLAVLLASCFSAVSSLWAFRNAERYERLRSAEGRWVEARLLGKRET